MSKYELKTKENEASVSAFLKSIEDPVRQNECKTINKLMSEVTGWKPKMWGGSIVGYGSYTYKGKTSSGEWFILGWAPRKGNLTMYFMTNFDDHKDIMDKLGKYSLGKSCLYAKKLEDIELNALKKLIKRTMKFDPKYSAS